MRMRIYINENIYGKEFSEYNFNSYQINFVFTCLKTFIKNYSMKKIKSLFKHYSITIIKSTRNKQQFFL